MGRNRYADCQAGRMNRLLAVIGRCKPLIGTCIGTVLLVGCAGVRQGADCPDLNGTYTNQADGSTERLSALLLAGRPGADAARFVAVSMAADGERQRLLVAAGAQRGTLNHGVDFVCNADGLRLLRPSRTRLDLGEVLVDELDTFYTFDKAPGGALRASTSAVEHATVGGVPLSGPERRGAALRWKAVAAGSAR